MNEKFKLLALQATLGTADFDAGSYYVATPDRMQRFAELIVQECMRQVEEQYKPVLEDEAMMKDTHWDGYVQCGVDSYVAIREHFFGVEQ